MHCAGVSSAPGSCALCRAVGCLVILNQSISSSFLPEWLYSIHVLINIIILPLQTGSHYGVPNQHARAGHLLHSDECFNPENVVPEAHRRLVCGPHLQEFSRDRVPRGRREPPTDGSRGWYPDEGDADGTEDQDSPKAKSPSESQLRPQDRFSDPAGDDLRGVLLFLDLGMRLFVWRSPLF